MTPTVTRPHLTPSTNIGGPLLIGVSVALVFLVAVAMVPAQRLPRFVDRLTVVNPTVYSVEVDVTEMGSASWLSLGAFNRESARDANEVIDHGPRWVFRFSSGGVEAGEIAVGRAELEQGKWRVTVPDEVAQRLQAKGLTPSAP